MLAAWQSLRDAFSPALGISDDPQGSTDGGGDGLGCALFVRLLGVVYLIAFASLWPQLLGLVGARGMLPVAPFLHAVAAQLGVDRYVMMPTLLWLGCSDAALQLCCALGLGGALLVIGGRLVWPALALSWVSYLSLVSVGRDFLSFQWDTLLLECGFLALLLVPVRPLWRGLRAFVPAGRWLLLWLLWRLMFGAGWVKLRSGDPTWRDLTALHYHFFTQPLPTWLGYYAHRLPDALKRLSVLGTFVIELGVPVLMLLGWSRPGQAVRRWAWFLIVGLMLLIAATGNYGFFNLLTVALGVLLLPAAWLRRVLPRWFQRWLDPTRTREVAAHQTPPTPVGWWPLRATVAVLLLVVSCGHFLPLFIPRAALPTPLRQLVSVTEPFHLASRYGLFAVMTTTRPEIIIEGSRDGQTWLPYEFKYKPGDLRRAPRWSAPHQPRLDWQMWFAAMGPPEDSSWLQGLCIRLLQGAPEVLWLLDRDPFAGRPPRYLRATRYSYRFTTAAERAQTGDYWHRDSSETYISPVSLSD